MKTVMCFMMRGYRYCISPFMGYNCRFYPSCSEYCLEAIKTFGVLKGSYLMLRRLSRCHPFHEGGVDFLPASPTTEKEKNISTGVRI